MTTGMCAIHVQIYEWYALPKPDMHAMWKVNSNVSTDKCLTLPFLEFDAAESLLDNIAPFGYVSTHPQLGSCTLN